MAGILWLNGDGEVVVTLCVFVCVCVLSSPLPHTMLLALSVECVLDAVYCTAYV